MTTRMLGDTLVANRSVNASSQALYETQRLIDESEKEINKIKV